MSKRFACLSLSTSRRLAVFLGAISLVAFAPSTQLSAQAPPGPPGNPAANTCVLLATSPGALGPNPRATVLTSTKFGGRNGSIQARATRNGYSVSVLGPNGFTNSPIGGGDDVKFETQYSMRRATKAFSVPATITTPINRGRTEIEINVQARKLSGAFTAGVYATEVLVRCE